MNKLRRSQSVLDVIDYFPNIEKFHKHVIINVYFIIIMYNLYYALLLYLLFC